MEETKNQPNNEALEAVTSFFKQDFLKMLILFFKEPISGTYSLLADKKDKLIQSISLIGLTFVLYILLPYISGMGSFMSFGRVLQFALLPVVFMLFVILFTFGLKLISGKPDIKAELFTGALQAFPFMLLFVFSVILKLFGKSEFMGYLSYIIMIYSSLMMINIVTQSLKASNTKDAVAWYASPAVVVLSGYLVYEILIAPLLQSLYLF